jgi:hypothetical protein
MNHFGRFIVLGLLATAFASPACAQPQKEKHAMSDATGSIKAEVASILARYDQSRDPQLLGDAADQITREDGSAPPDPAQAAPAAHERLALWLDLFSRFKRDLDPGFDPDKPPPNRVLPPKMNGMQLPPGVPPSSIPDPELRKKYEYDIEHNQERLDRFAEQLKLHEAHQSLVERAVESLKDARETLGLKQQDIDAALAKADIAPADRDALRARAPH